MKKQEAIDLIKLKLSNDTPVEEIKEIIISQDKIGNSNPTEEIWNSLLIEADRAIEIENNAKWQGGAFEIEERETKRRKYKKCLTTMDKAGNIVSVDKELKMVMISEAQASLLNRAKISQKGFIVQYVKA